MQTFVLFLYAAAAVILLGTAIAKSTAQAQKRLNWPKEPNFLRWHLPLWLVVLAEVAMALFFLASPHPSVTGIVLGFTYMGITLGAWTLKGKDCACFGMSSTPVGKMHIGGCLFMAVLCFLSAIIITSWDVSIKIRILALVIGTATFVLGLEGYRRNKATNQATNLERAKKLLVVTSPTCTACASLKLLENGTRSKHNEAVAWLEMGGTEPSEKAAELDHVDKFPAVVVIGEQEHQVLNIVYGVAECRQILTEFRMKLAAKQRMGSHAQA